MLTRAFEPVVSLDSSEEGVAADMHQELRALSVDLSEGRADAAEADIEALRRLALERGVSLPADYLDFVRERDAAMGDIGETYIEMWPVSDVFTTAHYEEQPYEDVLLFAGNGGNTIYGFDARRGGLIIEGDYIGLGRDHTIPHGYTLKEFFRSLASREE